MKRAFTDTEELEICRLYTEPNKDGFYMGAGQIAERFSSNKRTIHNILNRHGIEKRSKYFYVQNQPHHNLTRVPPEGEQPPLCKCGCGQPVEWLQKKDGWAKYVKGHYTRAGKQAPSWRGGNVTLICQQCGKSYEVAPHKSKVSRYCSPDCMGIAKRSPHYEGRERWIKWATVRTRIRKRDNWTCQDCGFYGKGIKRAIHVHHIDENPTNNTDSNLVCLCARCHLSRHGCVLPDDWEYGGVSL